DHKHVEVLAVVGLRGGRVVVFVLLIVLHEGLQNNVQPALGIVSLYRQVEIIKKLNGPERVGVVTQIVEVGADAAMQNAAQVGQGHEAGMKEVPAVGANELAHGLPVGVPGKALQRGKLP